MDIASMVLASHDHWADHHGAWEPIIHVLWILLIFGGIFFLIRRGGCARRHHRGGSGESVLGERYAKGEIDEREYRERLEVLKNVSEKRR